MNNLDNNEIAPLRVAARPSDSLDEFNVYYQAFKNKKGLVKVKLTQDDMRMPSQYHMAYAEVKALEYLLAGIEILSAGRKGDTVEITVTSKHFKTVMMINMLTRQQRGALLSEAKALKYIKNTKLPLAVYTQMASFIPSLIARFLGASILVSNDTKWIEPVVKDKDIHYVVSSQVAMHRAEINGREIMISAHAFNRFKQRVSFNTPQELWNAFLAYFRQATIKLPIGEKYKKLYESRGDEFLTHYYDPEFSWHFFVAENRGSLYLLTCYKESISDKNH